MVNILKTPPKNWKVVKISDVLFFQEGPGVRKWQFRDKGVKLLNVGNINEGKINLNKTKIYISEEEAYGKYSHFLVKEGDLLIACSGITVDNFHNKIAFIKKEHLPLCLNTSTMRFNLSKSNDVDLNYFKYYLQTVLFTSQLRKLITGSSQLNFGPSHIKKINLFLPSLAEQQRIAGILDEADKLRQLNKQLITKYEQLSQSLFLEMFGDPVTNPKGWDKRKLGDVCDVGSSKRVFVNELVEEGIPFYRGTEVGKLGEGKLIQPTLFITKEHYDKLKKSKGIPKKGDLLMPSICPDGRIWVVNSDNEFYFKDGRVLWVQVDNNFINSIYLRYHLKGSFFVNYNNIASGTTFAELKIVALKKMNIFYPHINLQTKFAERVQLIEAQKQQAQEALQKSEDLFNALLQKAFKGEL
ncbi:restriction endonuclease subunit S [Tenacibaculum mesophilum]|uniref:restriction endonuclease subunit S n=1 Tax=Tenacibaculum mesophilum TaxID=104268 RepID=UPI0006495111|nr:restriction endonuclease subunit S [Tenacibaculum mesophilum]